MWCRVLWHGYRSDESRRHHVDTEDNASVRQLVRRLLVAWAGQLLCRVQWHGYRSDESRRHHVDTEDNASVICLVLRLLVS